MRVRVGAQRFSVFGAALLWFLHLQEHFREHFAPTVEIGFRPADFIFGVGDGSETRDRFGGFLRT